MIEIILALGIVITYMIGYKMGVNAGLDKAKQIIDFVEETLKEGKKDDS